MLGVELLDQKTKSRHKGMDVSVELSNGKHYFTIAAAAELAGNLNEMLAYWKKQKDAEQGVQADKQ